MDASFRHGGPGLHELILRSFREREELFGLVLAAYRVELTGLLSRAARSGFEEGDTELVMDLADRIAQAARIADLAPIRTDAISLGAYASAAEGGGEDEEGKVLLAGLKLIDRILDTAKEREVAAEPKRPKVLS